MQPARPPSSLQAAAGPHLLDTSMFWGATGGVRRVLASKQAQLHRLGWRHSILAPGVQGEGLVDCGGLPLPFSGGYRFVVNRARAQRQMEALAPALIESADPYVLAWATLGAAERLRVPAVAFCHSHLPALAARLVGGERGTATRRGFEAERWARRYLVNLYRHFDAVLAPSQGLAERLRAWGVPRVAHQPLGVDCSAFRPEARDLAWRDALCRSLGVAPATRLLVYTGRFAVEKNLPLLSSAVERLGPGHLLLAVGSGPRPPNGPAVRTLPPERDSVRLARLVASCDVYVHAGDQETFGLGVLEAMACGTPVVTTAAGGLGELTAGAGLQVERASAGPWAEAMRAALDGGPGGGREAALARARQQDWPRVVAQMARRYTDLIGRSDAPALLPQGAAVPLLARQR